MAFEHDTLVQGTLLGALTQGQRVVVLTGAGVSAASGVPTFRDAQTGLWEKDDPMELATPQAFAKDPRKVAAWYEFRRGLVEGCEPNSGHLAIAQLQQLLASKGAELVLVTQNVDGLHTRAGSQNVLHLHGDLLRWRCSVCGERTDRRGLPVLPPEDCPPTCEVCGEYLRPDVVWFNEMLPPAVLRAAQDACAGCTVFIAAGTSGVVYPAAQLVQFAREAGALCIDVNLNGSDNASSFDHVIREGSEACFPRWAGALEATDA